MNKETLKPLAGVLGVGLIALFFILSMTGKIYGDEYIFLRITANLPNASTSADWILNDAPYYVSPNLSDTFYQDAYTTTVWIHPLLPQYLTYPVSKIVNLQNPKIARSFSLILALIAMGFIADIIRRKYGSTIAILSLLPFPLALQLLPDGLWLYNDAFMMVFFSVSIWLLYTRTNSKWLWLTVPAMLMSKEVSILLLIPLAIAWTTRAHTYRPLYKLAIMTLPLVAWFVYMGIATGDMLYYIHHWLSLTGSTTFANLGGFQNVIRYYLLNWGLAFFAILTIPGLYLIISKRAWQDLSFVAFYLVMVVYAVGWGMVPYQVFAMLFSGMYLTAITAKRVVQD